MLQPIVVYNRRHYHTQSIYCLLTMAKCTPLRGYCNVPELYYPTVVSLYDETPKTLAGFFAHTKVSCAIQLLRLLYVLQYIPIYLLGYNIVVVCTHIMCRRKRGYKKFLGEKNKVLTKTENYDDWATRQEEGRLGDVFRKVLSSGTRSSLYTHGGVDFLIICVRGEGTMFITVVTKITIRSINSCIYYTCI